MKRFAWTAIACMALGAVGIGRLQGPLAAQVHALRQRDDVFLLPPPAELRAMTLGYRAAAADLLWAKLVLEYGMHWHDKRAFPDIVRYLDGILAVEPDFPLLYAFADTLLLFTPVGGTDADAHTARIYLERGTRERPFDPEVWLHYGQFVAFLAPSFLKDESEIEAWRRDGAMAIMRSVELGSDADRTLAASTILSKAGEGKATLRNLERAYAVADNPETRRQILFKLQRLHASFESERALAVVEDQWKAYYPFLSRGTALLLGPHRDPVACAGPQSYAEAACPPDWSRAIGEEGSP